MSPSDIDKEKECIDCGKGPCTMNCGPKIEPQKTKVSPEFEAAVRRAKRRGKFKPVHYRGVRD